VGNEFRSELRARLLGPRSQLDRFLDPSVYGPLVDAFTRRRAVPGLTRQGLYQRAFMLLALDLHLTRTAA
jgi:hypothetical protein